ncbi:hypothetical protein M1247_33020 [Mycobacterium sp. 21AC1]|uniref:hypothetical protein n=1 Tax=[Mycobacterium] appelbergii TaxID=2939269 RepID=UPI0029390E19|nr:hypothetical protein [Mycobacterium sp. 21AC1]MDV3129767.1 hypothetical protein [Mycobacterium sp. 21AC1]
MAGRSARHLVGFVAAVVAAMAWTVAAGCLVLLGRFAAADTRCGHVQPRVDMGGGWIVIVTVVVWAAPFVALAIARRRRWQVTLGTLAVLIAAAVVVDMFARPVAFCF